ncbi:hypothetical protein FY049_08225 [Acinetobacter sp. 1125_18A]
MGRQGCRRWAGVQDVPLAQQKIFVIFSSLKSEASPTQWYLNFECKVWHCKLFIIKQFIFPCN